MLGNNCCLYCKTKNPYDCASIAFENGWSKLTVKNDYAVRKYRYQGLVCPNCLKSEIMSLFFKRNNDNG